MESKTFSNFCGLLRKPDFKTFYRVIDSKMFHERGQGTTAPKFSDIPLKGIP